MVSAWPSPIGVTLSDPQPTSGDSPVGVPIDAPVCCRWSVQHSSPFPRRANQLVQLHLAIGCITERPEQLTIQTNGLTGTVSAESHTNKHTDTSGDATR